MNQEQATSHLYLKVVTSKDCNTTDLFQHLPKKPQARVGEKKRTRIAKDYGCSRIPNCERHGHNVYDWKVWLLTLEVMGACDELSSRKHFSIVIFNQLCSTTYKSHKAAGRCASLFRYDGPVVRWTVQPHPGPTAHFITDEWGQEQVWPSRWREALESCHLTADRLFCWITNRGSNTIKAPTLNEWPNFSGFGHKLQNALCKCWKVMATAFFSVMLQKQVPP